MTMIPIYMATQVDVVDYDERMVSFAGTSLDH